MEVRIDERVENKEDVLKLGISVGDFISFDSRAVITPSGYVKSRHLDDKASVITSYSIHYTKLYEYRVVRHPGYAGNIPPLLGIVLALGSVWTLIPAVVALIIAVISYNFV